MHPWAGNKRMLAWLVVLVDNLLPVPPVIVVWQINSRSLSEMKQSDG
jgi:hypothetical protein